MKILVLGAGRVGREVCRFLGKDHDICLVDKDCNRLEEVEGDLKRKELDASDHWSLIREMERYDGIINALPDSLSQWVLRAAIKARKKVVDVSIPTELPSYLEREAKRRGSQVLMDAAFFPGLSNFLLASLLREVGNAERAEIRGGEIPSRPIPPAFHQVDYFGRLLQTLREYATPARAIVSGSLVELDPLKSSPVELWGMRLEEAPVDKLRSLLNLKIKDMVAYSLRWPGHFERMRSLRDLGFLSEENLRGTAKVLSKSMIGKEDLAILEVSVKDPSDSFSYLVLARSEKSPSGAFLAGVMASIFSTCFFEQDLPPGVYFPEDLAKVEGISEEILSSLRGQGVEVRKEEYQEVIAHAQE